MNLPEWKYNAGQKKGSAGNGFCMRRICEGYIPAVVFADRGMISAAEMAAGQDCSREEASCTAGR